MTTTTRTEARPTRRFLQGLEDQHVTLHLDGGARTLIGAGIIGTLIKVATLPIKQGLMTTSLAVVQEASGYTWAVPTNEITRIVYDAR